MIHLREAWKTWFIKMTEIAKTLHCSHFAIKKILCVANIHVFRKHWISKANDHKHCVNVSTSTRLYLPPKTIKHLVEIHDIYTFICHCYMLTVIQRMNTCSSTNVTKPFRHIPSIVAECLSMISTYNFMCNDLKLKDILL